ncbi:GGDEF domain-containing protein [Massilia phyllosphaerae]|uniref:GGDEF domain-containing protein n=1 Tax=Massilia phyllosphaerae TaxID=3106034 RepID=UPI002B1CB093|nr:GGDEF domain-containing protein [Massilia sp. SGZ-792]
MLLVLRSLARHGVAGVRAWSQANGLAIAALLLFMGRGVLPDLLSIEAANLLFLGAPAMMYAGFLQHLGRPVPARRLCAGVGVSISLLALVHYLSDSAALRIALTSASHGVVYALILFCLAGHARFAGATYPQRFSAGVALLLVAIHAARTLIYTALHDSAATIFDHSPLNLAFFTLGTLALPALTLGAVMMANDTVIRRTTWAAEHDHLTGAWSRRAFFSLAEREHERACRSGSPLSVLVFDVDHFKAINDTHGHAAGDAVLADIVLRTEAAIRNLDACARLGGEEFAVLLPDTGPDTARLVAGRLRTALDQAAGGVRYTVSIGVASLAAGESLSALLKRADAALYAAKAGGRNRVCDAEPAPAPGQ